MARCQLKHVQRKKNSATINSTIVTVIARSAYIIIFNANSHDNYLCIFGYDITVTDCELDLLCL
jgi:hypothetical protein